MHSCDCLSLSYHLSAIATAKQKKQQQFRCATHNKRRQSRRVAVQQKNCRMFAIATHGIHKQYHFAALTRGNRFLTECRCMIQIEMHLDVYALPDAMLLYAYKHTGHTAAIADFVHLLRRQ